MKRFKRQTSLWFTIRKYSKKTIKDLTLKETVKQAQAMEGADKDSKALQGNNSTGVH